MFYELFVFRHGSMIGQISLGHPHTIPLVTPVVMPVVTPTIAPNIVPAIAPASGAHRHSQPLNPESQDSLRIG